MTTSLTPQAYAVKRRKLFDQFKTDAFHAIYKSQRVRTDGQLDLAFASAIDITQDGPDDDDRFRQWILTVRIPGARDAAFSGIDAAREAIRQRSGQRRQIRVQNAHKRCHDYRELVSMARAEGWL